MGVGDSKENIIKFISQNYQFHRRQDHLVLGHIQLMNSNKETLYPLIYFYDLAEDQFESCQAVRFHAENRPEFLLKLLGVRAWQQDMFCTSSKSHRFFFQYIQDNLLDDIKRRYSLKDFYPSDKIKAVLKCLLTALSHFHSNGLFFGSLTAAHVLFGRNNRIKLIDRDATANKQQDRELTPQNRCYIDPDKIQCLLNNKTQLSNYDPFKGDVWAAGLIMLQMMTLSSGKQIYDLKNLRIKEQVLTEMLSESRKRFGEGLVKVVQKMLIVHTADRKNAKDLLKQL